MRLKNQPRPMKCRASFQKMKGEKRRHTDHGIGLEDQADALGMLQITYRNRACLKFYGVTILLAIFASHGTPVIFCDQGNENSHSFTGLLIFTELLCCPHLPRDDRSQLHAVL